MQVRSVGSQQPPLKPAPGWQVAHDCDYVKRRNACLDPAERLANKAVLKAQEADRSAGRGVTKHDDIWPRVFLEAMERLSKEAEAKARRAAVKALPRRSATRAPKLRKFA